MAAEWLQHRATGSVRYTESMQFRIDADLFESFAPVMGVIAAHGIDNSIPTAPIAERMRQEEASARERFSVEGSLGAHPSIAAWRRVYKKLGADAYRASAEALTRRALKGDEIPSINALVDLYNIVSIKYTLPVGGEDLATIQGDIVLGYANGDEPFMRIGGTENEPPEKGEVVSKDDIGVICRRWNWREADRTKLTTSTTNAVLVVEGLGDIDIEEVRKATEELEALIKQHCGGQTRSAVLDQNLRSFELS